MSTGDSRDREPNPIDKYVGARIRIRRKALRISQGKLAEQLGLTFQQVQKYERGANRVSASKLYEIARALQASVSYFFENITDPAGEPQFGVGESESPTFAHDFIMTPEGPELAEVFPRIRSRRVRKQVLELVKALADDEPDLG